MSNWTPLCSNLSSASLWIRPPAAERWNIDSGGFDQAFAPRVHATPVNITMETNTVQGNPTSVAALTRNQPQKEWDKLETYRKVLYCMLFSLTFLLLTYKNKKQKSLRIRWSNHNIKSKLDTQTQNNRKLKNEFSLTIWVWYGWSVHWWQNSRMNESVPRQADSDNHQKLLKIKRV